MPKRVPKTNRAPEAVPVLSDERYRRLLEDVKALLDQASRSEDNTRVATHWALGRRIARERLRSDAGYHNSILRDLSAGASVAKRTLQYAVKLHASYAKCPKSSLTLRHYRVLLDCPLPLRARYERIAIDEGLSAPSLYARITKDQREAAGTTTLLPRPVDPSYLYRASIDQVIDGDTFDLRIDVGFHMSRVDRFRLASVNCPEMISPARGGFETRPLNAGRRARDFVYQRLTAAKSIVVKTERTDIHGRYVTHLFYSSEDLSITACFTQGTHLNAELLAAGHAELAV